MEVQRVIEETEAEFHQRIGAPDWPELSFADWTAAGLGRAVALIEALLERGGDQISLDQAQEFLAEYYRRLAQPDRDCLGEIR